MKYAANGDAPTEYLGTFIVPALRRLQIPDEFLRPDPVDTLASFISQSACKVAEVLITGHITAPKRSYRKAFPDIMNFSFDRTLVEYMFRRQLVDVESGDDFSAGDETTSDSDSE